MHDPDPVLGHLPELDLTPLFDAACGFTAVLSPDEVKHGHLSAAEWADVRRLALEILTRSAADLEALARTNPDHLVELATGLDAFLCWRQADTALLKTAQVRVIWALGRSAHPAPK